MNIVVLIDHKDFAHTLYSLFCCISMATVLNLDLLRSFRLCRFTNLFLFILNPCLLRCNRMYSASSGQVASWHLIGYFIDIDVWLIRFLNLKKEFKHAHSNTRRRFHISRANYAWRFVVGISLNEESPHAQHIVSRLRKWGFKFLYYSIWFPSKSSKYTFISR